MKVSYPEKNGKKTDLKFRNSFGRYLITNFNTWHGGIHLEGANKQIRAIADGRIIGYRLKKQYLFEEETNSMVSTKENEASSENDNCKEKKGFNYSNSFMLLQHDIPLSRTTVEKDNKGNDVEKIEKKYVTFYSLYNHLMCLDELKKKTKKEEIPIFLQKEETKVIANNKLGATTKVEGLNARVPVKGKIKWTKSYNYTIKVVIPNGTLVEKVKKEGIEEKIGNWAKVKYTDPNGKVYEDAYISTNLKGDDTKRVEDLGNSYQITTTEDEGEFIDQSSVSETDKNKEGAIIYESTSKESNQKGIIANGNPVIIAKKDKNWYQIEGKKGYCYKNDFETKVYLDESKIIADDITACDIPIKANDLIGFTGAYEHGAAGRKEYNTCQVDVFMAEGAEDFIDNCYGAGSKEDKKYLSFPECTKIKKRIEVDIDLKQDTIVQVLDVKDIYAKVKIPPKPKEKPVRAVFETSFLRDSKNMSYSDSGGAHYTIVDKTLFPKINAYFNNKLPNADVRLEWYKRCYKDGTPLPGRGSTARKNKENEIITSGKKAYRSLEYTPVPKEEKTKNPKEFWIEINHLDEKAVIEMIPERILDPKSIASTPTFNEYVTNYDNRYEQITYNRPNLKWLLPNENDNIIAEEDLEDKIYSSDINYSHLVDHGVIYTIKPKHFDEVNNAFGGKLLGLDAKLYYVSGITKKKNNNKVREKILYKQKEHDKKLNFKDKAHFKGCRKVAAGDKTEVLSNLKKGYLAVPEKSNDILDKELEKATAVKARPTIIKDIKHDSKIYRKLSFKSFKGNTPHTETGWVEITNIKEKDYFSAYNLNKFGFKHFNAGIEYMYDIQNVLGKPSTDSHFIKTLWDKIDVIKKDSVITNAELEHAYRFLEIQDEVSKMVCKHKIEWSYIFEEIKAEATEFYNYAIETLYDKELHKDLHKAKDEKLEGLKVKVENLAFWTDLRAAKYEKKKTADDNTTSNEEQQPVTNPVENNTTTEEDKVKLPERIMPNTDEVTHFHPIAFINHMKLIFGSGGINEDCPELVWGKKVSCEFRKRVVQISKRLECDPNHLMSIMALETAESFDPSIDNEVGKDKDSEKKGYVGLIQFGRSAVDDINSRYFLHKAKLSKTALVGMTAEEQLCYVECFLLRHKGKLKTLTDFYLAVIFPADVGKGDQKDHAVFNSSLTLNYKTNGEVKKDVTYYRKYGYDANPTFFKEETDKKGNKNGKTYVWEMTQKIKEVYDKGLEFKNTSINCECNNNCSCNKKCIDVKDKVSWITQFNKSERKRNSEGKLYMQTDACWRTSQKLLMSAGLGKTSGFKGGMIITAKENDTNTSIAVTTEAKAGVDYIDAELEKGKPVLVGLNHTLNYRHNGKIINEGTTDHYVVIVGRGCEDDKVYYRFYEVGTSWPHHGKNSKNKLFLGADFSLKGKASHRSEEYFVSQVRKN
ncbi:hypothetical protein [Olleya sp. ITB9]|uniref:hypothetical protein n=1 Tax=Olleya sp. ITB9 TaxID=1715648 RepID=UPI0006D1C0F0|nr:hypothetical protein [Olleya sp. ITB9]